MGLRNGCDRLYARRTREFKTVAPRTIFIQQPLAGTWDTVLTWPRAAQADTVSALAASWQRASGVRVIVRVVRWYDMVVCDIVLEMNGKELVYVHESHSQLSRSMTRSECSA
jgi:hypothetical protein